MAAILLPLTILFSCSTDQGNGAVVPTIKVEFSIQDDTPLVGVPIAFSNESTGLDDTTVFRWEFGDGETSEMVDAVHTYKTVGDYIVTLTVRADDVERKVSKELSVSLTNDVEGRPSLADALKELNGSIMVCAHRGVHYNAPENSIQSIRKAMEEGLDMVELDVRQTKDGVLILMHDKTINRTTNGSGTVSDFTYEQLRSLNLYKEDGTLTNEHIPTLREVLELCRGELFIDLDIDKKAPFDKVLNLVNQYGMLQQVLFYSSEFNVIRTMANYPEKDIMEMAIVRDESDFSTYESLGTDVVQYNVQDDILAQKIKEEPWYVFRNAYVNSNNSPWSDNFGELQEVLAVGGHIVQTDYPLEVKDKLQLEYLND
jgi:glycerophosphoryl diester phosphodiesterase